MEDEFHLGVKAIIQNNEGKILLLKINPKKLKKFEDKPYWDIPGGRMRKNNSIEETLKREVKEETGINIKKDFIAFTMVLSNIRIPIGKDSVGLILASFVCRVDDFKRIKLSDEHIDFGWFAPKEAKRLLSIKYPKDFIDKLSELG